MVVRGSASEYIKQYIPDAPYPLQKPVEIGRDVYARIQGIGPLVLGSNGEVSVFTAVKHLARARPEVKRLLSYSSTAIGKEIDDAVVQNPDDPWFDTVLLFRPDVLVDQNGKVYTGDSKSSWAAHRSSLCCRPTSTASTESWTGFLPLSAAVSGISA